MMKLLTVVTVTIFPVQALQLKAPALTLESGTELQTTGATELYKDDVLVSMTAQNPKPDDKDAVSDYGSIKNNIKYQYYLSDSELLSYANVQWKGWEQDTPVSLNGKKYLYVKAVVPEEAEYKQCIIFQAVSRYAMS